MQHVVRETEWNPLTNVDTIKLSATFDAKWEKTKWKKYFTDWGSETMASSTLTDDYSLLRNQRSKFTEH